jgi:hypothetical protein
MPAATATDHGPRLTLLNFRATSGEREQLQTLAARKGVTVTDLIRHGLKLQGFKPER